MKRQHEVVLEAMLDGDYAKTSRCLVDWTYDELFEFSMNLLKLRSQVDARRAELREQEMRSVA